jgi:tetratricopeptide (TPR) repeat protein
MKFAPLDPRIWKQRAAVVLHIGGWTNLLAECDRMLQSYPQSAPFWNSKARALEGMEQFEGALEACDHALESLSAHIETESDQSLREEVLQRRARALECLGQIAEMEPDKVAAH